MGEEGAVEEVPEKVPNLVCSGKVRMACSFDIAWTLLNDSIEHPELYDPNVARTRCLEREVDRKRSTRRTTHILNPKLMMLHSLDVKSPGTAPLVLYFDVDFDKTDREKFKVELLNSFRELGVARTTCRKFEIKLHQYGDFVEVHGPAAAIAEVQCKNLEGLTVSLPGEGEGKVVKCKAYTVRDKMLEAKAERMPKKAPAGEDGDEEVAAVNGGAGFPGGSDIPCEDDLKRIFDKIDENHNGVVEKKEVLALLQADEETREFCSKVTALQPLLNPDTWKEAFNRIDSTSVFAGNKDGVISWPEFRAFFIPQETLTHGVIVWGVESLRPWTYDQSTGYAYEEEMGYGVINHTIRVVDEGVLEYVMRVKFSCLDDSKVPDLLATLKPWVKKTAAGFKGVAEKIAFLCPRLAQEWDLYSHVLHHKMLRKAKDFQFMPMDLQRSPSALGNYSRSPTPGFGDGFTKYPDKKDSPRGNQGPQRPHSSLT